MIPLCMAFQRKFAVTGIAVQFGFGIIDGSLFENFSDFRLCDMPASHAASGMFGIMNLGWMPVEVLFIFEGTETEGNGAAAGLGFEPQEAKKAVKSGQAAATIFSWPQF